MNYQRITILLTLLLKNSRACVSQHRSRLQLLLLTALLLSAATGCDSEKANWNFARAVNANRSGNLEEAIEHLKLAAEQDPDNCRIPVMMAQIYAENGHGEIGISLCDDLAECFPANGDTEEVRSMCLQYLGKFEESLAAYKRSLSGKISRSPVELNNLAYYRALANKELEQAAADIGKAIKETDAQPWGESPLRLPLPIKTVVAAGLLSRSCDAQDSVLPLLDRKIAQFEAALASETEELYEPLARNIRTNFPLDRDLEDQFLQQRERVDFYSGCLLTMLATRALVLNDLEKFELADRDRNRIRSLDANFDRVASLLPAEPYCLATLDLAMTFLDTRGFIATLRPWDTEDTFEPTASYAQAIDDLDLAVLASEIKQRAIDSPLFNSSEIPAATIPRARAVGKHYTAVLVFHRLKAHQRQGNFAAAEIDQRMIESLGFQADANLF